MRVEPFGAPREDYRAGILHALVANLFGRAKGDPAHRWTDRFPEYREPMKPPTLAETRAMWTRALAVGRSLEPKKKGK